MIRIIFIKAKVARTSLQSEMVDRTYMADVLHILKIIHTAEGVAMANGFKCLVLVATLAHVLAVQKIGGSQLVLRI